MTDISKCSNENCKRKEECYRYKCKPSEYQCYAEFDEENCDYFLEINKN